MQENQQKKPHTDDFIARQAVLADDQALSELISVPMPTRGVMLSLQRKPSYFMSSNVVYHCQSQTVIEDHKTGKIVAFFSNGHRPCYINQEIQPLRYAADLRVNAAYRGKQLLKILGQQMQETMHDPDYSHTIIFSDNQAARAAMQSGKRGMPMWYDDCDIETLTLSGFKQSAALKRKLNTSAQQENLAKIERVQANKQNIVQMNAFVEEMAHYYNFIPVYDFAEIDENQDYYRDLKLSDFYLYFQDGKMVGMFGLWNQSKFKQSSISDYSVKIALLRPFYNLWMKLTGGILLPKKGQHFKYHVLHSLLCAPDNLILHDRMLRDALALSKQKAINCISYTLSLNDPRQQLNQYYKGQILSGMHGFYSFKENPVLSFDRSKISYLEVGRI